MRLRVLLILFGALCVIATFTFPLWQPLLVSEIVEDPFPGLSASQQASFTALSAEEQALYLALREEDPQLALAMVTAALRPPSTVDSEEEPVPEDTAVEIADGEFNRIDAIRWAQGTATIYELPDSRKILRLEEFRSATGPDLYVLLSVSEAPLTQEEVELGDLHFELGPLKGNIGDQNYEIPAELDLTLYNSVVIYSKPYHVVFSTATI